MCLEIPSIMETHPMFATLYPCVAKTRNTTRRVLTLRLSWHLVLVTRSRGGHFRFRVHQTPRPDMFHAHQLRRATESTFGRSADNVGKDEAPSHQILISWCSSPFWLTPSPEQLPSRRKLSKSRHAVNSGRPSMMTPYLPYARIGK